MRKTITVKVRCFSIVRQALGKSSFELQLAVPATTATLLEQIHQMEPSLKEYPIRMAVNREYVTDDRLLTEGDEVALIPPVSGG